MLQLVASSLFGEKANFEQFLFKNAKHHDKKHEEIFFETFKIDPSFLRPKRGQTISHFFILT
jgi:hypothetical protein